MNGRPLPIETGAPLRLIIPVKYGVKHLKRIGTSSSATSARRTTGTNAGMITFAACNQF